MFTVALKVILSLTIGVIFWFFAFLVFMVYAFMPITKLFNSIIFAVTAPTLYLLLINVLLKRLFKETGWKSILSNLAITVVATGLSLYVIDLTARVVR
jgi:hypothetical protein